MEMDGTIDALSAHVPQTQYGTYKGEDGLEYCNNCHTRVQCRVDFLGKEKIVCCICKCRNDWLEAQKKEKEQREFEDTVRDLRKMGFIDAPLRNCTFENADKGSEVTLSPMHQYVDNFADFKRRGVGLLLYGRVGTGKTYAAACVANALIDCGHSVLMTNFMRVYNELQGKFDGRQEYLDRMNHFELLIIDDLAAERNTETMQELVFNVIDNRCRAQKPMIITTNLTAQELKNPQTQREARIYDRLIGCCVPVEINGSSHRRGRATDELKRDRKVLGL